MYSWVYTAFLMPPLFIAASTIVSPVATPPQDTGSTSFPDLGWGNSIVMQNATGGGFHVNPGRRGQPARLRVPANSASRDDCYKCDDTQRHSHTHNKQQLAGLLNDCQRPNDHGTATGETPSALCTAVHSKVNGSGVRFGNAASSAFNRSARALLMGCVENHSMRPSSFSESF